MYVDRIARILRKHRYAQFADVLGSFKEILTDMRYPCVICEEGIKISPRFFNQFTLKQQTFALMHELCHYIFWHFRYVEKGCDLLKSNIACDAVINHQLLSGKLISVDLLAPTKGIVTNEIFTKHIDLANRVWSDYFKYSCWGFSEERLNSDIAYKYMVELEKEKQAKHQSLKKELREMFTSQQKEQNNEESNQDFDEQESDLNDVDTESDNKDFDDEDFDDEDFDDEDSQLESSDKNSDFDNVDYNDFEDADSENYEYSNDFEDGENREPEEGFETGNDLDYNDFSQGGENQNSFDYNNLQDDMPDSEEDLNSEFDLGSNSLPGQEYEEGFEGWDESLEQRINAQLKNEKHINSLLNEMEKEAVKNRDVSTLNKCFSQRELIAPREQVNWQIVFKQAVLKGSALKKEYSFARPNRHNLSIQRASHSRAQLPNSIATRPLPSVHVFVDTSGSVKDNQLSRVLYEVQQVFKICSCFDLEVTPFNTRLGNTCVSKAGSHFNISNFNFSRGGTEFCPIWDLYFKNGKKQPDICIIITDGIPNDRTEWTKCCKMIGKRTIFVTNQRWFTPPEPKMEVIYRDF